MSDAPRMQPAEPPFSPDVQAWLDRTMPTGRAPLTLFTTMARDTRLFTRFFAGGLLDRGHLTLRQREIVIDRTTALCGAEYEWGVHIAFFGARVQLTPEQQHATVHADAQAACWADDERLLIRLCDALHRDATVDDTLWQALRAQFSEPALLEVLMLCGQYHTVSYLANALRLPLEFDAARFPLAATAS